MASWGLAVRGTLEHYGTSWPWTQRITSFHMTSKRGVAFVAAIAAPAVLGSFSAASSSFRLDLLAELRSEPGAGEEL